MLELFCINRKALIYNLINVRNFKCEKLSVTTSNCNLTLNQGSDFGDCALSDAFLPFSPPLFGGGGGVYNSCGAEQAVEVFHV